MRRLRLAYWQRGVVILGLGAGGFGLLMLLRPRTQIQEPARRIPAVRTVPAEVRSGDLAVKGNGTVRPSAEITLASEVSGRVVWVSPALVSGGRFREGKVLLRIDPADYENAVEGARAEVAQRRVEVLQAEEEVALAREEYRRLQRREEIETPPDSAEMGRLLFREPQLEAARAMLRRAGARLEDAELALDRATIRAPFDGIVRSETVDRGQYVAPGQALARLYAAEAVEIVVSLSSEKAALIPDLWDARAGGSGAEIPATVSARYGGREYRWTGFVDRAESALDEETRTVDVVVRVARPFDSGVTGGTDRSRPSGVAGQETGPGRPPLLLGTYTAVHIRGPTLDRYVVVPRAALRDGPVVWTVHQDSLLRIEPVEVIQEIEGEAYLLAELEDGTPVVVSPLAAVTDGMTVRLVAPPEPLELGSEVSASESGSASEELP